jgi:predicted transcriptional regulator
VSKIESGQNDPRLGTVRKMATVINQA